VQGLQQRLAAAEAEKRSLQETLVQTEALIRKARQEHLDELEAAKRDMGQHTAAMQASVQEHRLAVWPKVLICAPMSKHLMFEAL
jgi:glucose-6-phosphate-specific signal transduction histidine kinase